MTKLKLVTSNLSTRPKRSRSDVLIRFFLAYILPTVFLFLMLRYCMWLNYTNTHCQIGVGICNGQPSLLALYGEVFATIAWFVWCVKAWISQRRIARG